jgi:hypothetical protein
MAEIKLSPGTCWGRAKGTKEYRILLEATFDTSIYEKVSGPEPEPEARKQLPAEVKLETPAELAEKSFQELKALPEFKQFPASKNWRSKEELIQAIMEARAKVKAD